MPGKNFHSYKIEFCGLQQKDATFDETEVPWWDIVQKSQNGCYFIAHCFDMVNHFYFSIDDCYNMETVAYDYLYYFIIFHYWLF